MNTAERTVLVGVVAGALAIGLYLRERQRAGLLEWRRDLPVALAMAAGLTAFGLLLLGAPGLFSLPVFAIAGGITGYVLTRSATPAGRYAGWGLLVAVAAGTLAGVLRLMA